MRSWKNRNISVKNEEVMEFLSMEEAHADFKGLKICELGRTKYYCKNCKTDARILIKSVKDVEFVSIGKQTRYCKDCGGAALCFHGKQTAIRNAEVLRSVSTPRTKEDALNATAEISVIMI